MQNQLKAGSFVGTKAELSHDVQFFFYARAMKWTVLRWPYQFNARANQARFLSIHRFSNWIRAVQCNFLTDILDFVYLRFA